jgi:formate dehydrogenase subunit beta
MTVFALPNTDGTLSGALAGFFEKLLAEKLVDGILAAAPTPYSPLPMPILFTDPAQVKTATPLAPAAPFNAARQAASVTRHETGRRLALVLRPCEIRALIELAKLKQCDLGNTVIIGIECLGRMENSVFLDNISRSSELSENFYRDPALQELICPACKACTRFLPERGDINVCLMGMDKTSRIGLTADTDEGSRLLTQSGIETGIAPDQRTARIDEMKTKRNNARMLFIEAVREKTDAVNKLQTYFATCLNCYNCRTACPVCYCRECVFLTDVFAADPEGIFRRAEKKGMVKLPRDTTMFHLTRMAHMAHACVACGHCSSVCPSHIPVADVFIRVSEEVQRLYDYVPGRDLSEPIPLLVFDKNNAALNRKVDK